MNKFYLKLLNICFEQKKCLLIKKNWLKVSVIGLVVLMICQNSTLQAQNSDFLFINGRLLKEADITDSLNNLLDDTRIPAISVAVIENNQIVYKNTLGIKDVKRKTKVNKRTVFECAFSN